MSLSHPTRMLIATAGLVALAGLTACGGGSAGAGAGGAASPTTAGGSGAAADAPTSAADTAGSAAPDPCALLSAADLTSAYGIQFGDGRKTDSEPAASQGFRACTWSNADGTSSFVLQTKASGGPSGESASDLFDQSKDLYPDATDAGVADKSILLQEDAGFLAVKGDVFVQGNTITFADKPAGATATVLRTVVAALD